MDQQFQVYRLLWYRKRVLQTCEHCQQFATIFKVIHEIVHSTVGRSISLEII